jgi:RimJ/RimL family protein N-acetyltransferase
MRRRVFVDPKRPAARDLLYFGDPAPPDRKPRPSEAAGQPMKMLGRSGTFFTHCCVTGDGMTLRDVNQDDLPIFFAHQQDPAANGMAAFSAREWDTFMAHWRVKVLGDASVRKKKIIVDSNVAGNIGSWEQSGKRLVGYWIGRDYWGRGVATAALSAFLEHETTRPLYAYVAVHNLGSIRVLEKGGFHRVGDCTRGVFGVEEYLFRLDA